MKLVASLVVRNELGRYLEPCIESLQEFCDEIVAWDDGSTDETLEWLMNHGVLCAHELSRHPRFFEHEGNVRQNLLDATLAQTPTYVLSIDADEFVSDGAAVRAACEAGHASYGLTMMECWEAVEDGLCIRVDGGWRPHRVHALWQVPDRMDNSWRIADRALACGRVPMAVDRRGAHPIDADILHFGWSNEVARIARHERYAIADGGRFHRSAHLDSILNDCEGVVLERMDWPPSLLPRRDAILARVTSGMSPPVTS